MTDDKLIKALFKLSAVIEETVSLGKFEQLLTTLQRTTVAIERIADHLSKVKPKPLLTAEEVGESLGVSAALVYRLAQRNALRSVKVAVQSDFVTKTLRLTRIGTGNDCTRTICRSI